MQENATNAGRLSTLYLMCLTAGVAIAISVARGIAVLRFPADAVYIQLGSPDFNGLQALLASVYGACVTTFVFAWRSGGLWSSPGKTLALLFAAMCVIECSGELIAASIMHSRMQIEPPSNAPDYRGWIAGIWYRLFPSAIGFLVGLPVIAVIIYKTRLQSVQWRVVWISFFISALLMIARLHFDFDEEFAPAITEWYSEVCLAAPICLIGMALLISLVRRQRIDWWTVITVVPILIGGLVLTLVRFSVIPSGW